jgi:Meiotically up-regulated gene 113
MSYVVIIEAFGDYHISLNRYAITVASDPERGLAHLQAFSPIPCALVHSIKTDNRSEILEKTLHIRYQQQRDHSFWFNLTTEEITFLKSITAENFNRLPGLLRKALPPDTSKQDLEKLVNEQAELCERLLK